MHHEYIQDDATHPETELLNKIAIEQALALLTPAERDMMVMVAAYSVPEGYTGAWPPTLTDIGRFIGETYDGAPLSEAAIRLRRDKVSAKMRAQHAVTGKRAGSPRRMP